MTRHTLAENGRGGAVAQDGAGREEARYDVVVIGGGAAGLSGALALVRSRRSVLVVDGGQPRNAPAAHVHNYLTRDGTPPAELAALGRAEVASYGGVITSGSVTQVERSEREGQPDAFKVTLQDASTVYARRLLVATGVVDELPDLPGVAERWGRDVLHCPYCHGWEVRDQAIGILGTGSLAAQKALLFRQWSADVILFQHTAAPLTEEQAEQLLARGIRVVDEEVVALEVVDDQLAGVRLASGAFMPRQVVVVAPRMSARAELLDMLGLTLASQETGGQVVSAYVAADHAGATAVTGVWAAGNITDPFGHVMSSAAAGLKAGAAINADLIAEDTSLAVAALRAQQAPT